MLYNMLSFSLSRDDRTKQNFQQSANEDYHFAIHTIRRYVKDCNKNTYQAVMTLDKCYLENTGATLYPECLLALVSEDLKTNYYMNPHSDKSTRDCIEQIRSMILRHFNTDSTEYSVVFTSGCTQSLKLVVESFKFSGETLNQEEEDDEETKGNFVYLTNNHTSALGLREIAVDKNADIVHISHQDFITALNQKQVTPWKDKDKDDGNSLFVYPAQSNFNGYKYTLDCVQLIKDGCLDSYVMKSLCQINRNWFILMDAAAFVSTNKLDLSKVQPDFVTLSFYKIFGYPTGLGALLIKRSSEHVLCEKKYFGGGTVDIVLSGEDFHMKRPNISERFEDGTCSFLSIIALKHCFDTMQKLIPKVIDTDLMKTISHHTFYLAKDLYMQLSELTHSNGQKAAVLYMDSDFSDINQQGAIVTFNLIRDDGTYIGYAEFQHMAELFSISIRTGCFCNAGSCQMHLKATNKEIKDMYKAGHKCGDEIDLLHGKPTGAVRASFGYFNTFLDVDKLIHMICRCFVITTIKKPIRSLVTNSIEKKRPKPILLNGELRKTINGFSFRSVINNNRIGYGNDSDQSSMDSGIELKEISIFPIKSCGAFKIKKGWTIGPKGFLFDREWMIVKENGVCLTQKQNTIMCLIQPKIDLELSVLTLSFKGKTSISIPLEMNSQKSTSGSMCHSRICSDTVMGYDCGDPVANWISEAINISYLRLIKQSNNDGRTLKKKHGGEQRLLSLSNQAQYLLINMATVRWLRDKINDPDFADDTDMLVDRFRGNLIIDMGTELAERDWKKVMIGNQIFRVDGQCNRCQMVCINQQNGQKTIEPLRTISEQFAGKLRFGIYLSYIGTVDGTDDRSLERNTCVTPIIEDDAIANGR